MRVVTAVVFSAVGMVLTFAATAEGQEKRAGHQPTIFDDTWPTDGSKPKQPAKGPKATRPDAAEAPRPAPAKPPESPAPTSGAPASEPRAGTRAPIPDSSAQEAAGRIVRELFESDYRDTSAAGKHRLATKLRRQAEKTGDDPAGRFVLLREARDLAINAGELELALGIVDQIGRQYATDWLPMKATAFLAVSPRVPASSAASFVSHGQTLLAHLLRADDYANASRLVVELVAVATRSHDLALVRTAQGIAQETQGILAEYDRVKLAFVKLRIDPKDPGGNLVVGQFYCFLKGEWDRGLPMLALGSDPVLSGLARTELAGPGTPLDQASLADGWWELAQKQSPAAKVQTQGHAGGWYRQALPNLKGLHRALAEKRVSDLGGTDARAVAPKTVATTDR